MLFGKKLFKGLILWILSLTLVVFIFGTKIEVIIPSLGVLTGFIVLYYAPASFLKIFFIVGGGCIGFLIGLIFLIAPLKSLLKIKFTQLHLIIVLILFFILGAISGYLISKTERFRIFLK